MAALLSHSLMEKGCEVGIVRTEAPHLLDTSTHEFGAPIISWRNDIEVRRLISRSDACIYQVGNNFDYHGGGLYWLDKHPGLVCLHDFFLGHLFHEWAQTYRHQADTILEKWYGDGAAKRFFEFANHETFIDRAYESMPLTEWVCSKANGVITHSQWGCNRVMSSCPGPIRVVPLAYDSPNSGVSVVENRSTSEDSLRLLTIGHVNPNKRIPSVMQAISQSDLLREKVTYHLVGAIQSSTKEHLQQLAASLNVNLTVAGEVDASTLEQAINSSDVISCLRWPALEAASASAIEAMLYGKPVIVTATGFYNEIPDDCSIKIDQEDEIDQIQTALESLLEDRKRLRKIGTAGQEWASNTFTASNYSSQILAITEDMQKTNPAQISAKRISNTLAGWSASESIRGNSALIDPLAIFEHLYPNASLPQPESSGN